MKKNALKQLMSEGTPAVNGWIAIPDPFAAEMYAAQGWDSVTVDMQHGATDFSNAVSLFQAVAASGATVMARVPWNDPAIIMKTLDAGAYGIICPMINTRKEAEAFVEAGRYPPLGGRSFGPFRASHVAGADYWKEANGEVLLLAMIETAEAVSNLDQILQVKGLSGTYVGPGDLSLSMGRAPTLDPTDPEVLAAIATIARKTRAQGLIAGVHTDGAKTAQRRFADGFQFCTLLNDVRLLAMAAQTAVRETRGLAAGPAAKTY
jgi:4-hydroxy-2-oxoheptanedioate aldolase